MAVVIINTFPIIFLLCIITLPYSYSLTTSPTPTTTTVCNTTLYPDYCKTILSPTTTTNATVYHYGVYSIKHSISRARHFLSLVNRYLAKSTHYHLTPTAIGALEDCKVLAELNLEYLVDSLSTVNGVNRTLPVSKADEVQTVMSALVTNQMTCFDGIKSVLKNWSTGKGGSSGGGGLVRPLSEDSKLYSVSLALVTKGWVPNMKKNKPFKSSSRTIHTSFKGTGGRNTIPVPSTSDVSTTNQIFQKVISRKKLQPTTSKTQQRLSVKIKDIVTVNQDGTGNFTTITSALDAAPNRTDASDGYFIIHVTAGVYNEYISVEKPKKNVMIIGDGINKTIITGNRSVVDGSTTFRSATFAVVGPGFVGVNFTIRNTAGPGKGQAVALRNGADLSAFYSCGFEGYQDTLYIHSLRQFYSDCEIYGTVDFIFGNAAAVFQSCRILPRLPLPGQWNAITAQGRSDPNQNTGISIHNCSIIAAVELAVAMGKRNGARTYLGRPWKEYSRTVYMQTYIDSVVEPEGWREWSGEFALDTLYYGEFGNVGPGSSTGKRVGWKGYHVMNSTDASNFTASSFILADQWLPQTGVTYVAGLV